MVSRSQAINFRGTTLDTEELWLLAKEIFAIYPLEKLSMVFVQNEQVACAILEDKGGNEHTKEKGAMHFNIRKSCIPWYVSVKEDDDALPADGKNGNVQARHANGVQMIEEYNPG
jgi:hypothetical protein